MTINKTFLSIDNAEKRCFIHRDYIAHCLRFTHVLKRLLKVKQAINLLDVGCGKETPLLKMIYTSKMSALINKYIGLEAGKINAPEFVHKIDYELIENTLIQDLECKISKFDIITMFEVLEHMPPSNVINTLLKLKSLMNEDSELIVSTPNYNKQVGAAGNHQNEMGYKLLSKLFNFFGLEVIEKYGTFASIRDYKGLLSESQLDTFKKLSEYYDSNYLATIFSPMFPEVSRNVLYVLKLNASIAKPDFANILAEIECYTNNLTWRTEIETLLCSQVI
jgi:2-polyprenyl-3-methyl-5-hydroxy-6-metoxy-1,4-benzoquinol methylase